MGSDPAAATAVYGKGGHQNLGCAVDLYLSGAAGVPDFDRQNMHQNFVSFPPSVCDLNEAPSPKRTARVLHTEPPQ
jgi:hypothetical protein